MPSSAPLLILMVADGGVPFGAGKTTIAATIRYVLESRYGIDTTADEDRDDTLTANNDPHLQVFKEVLPNEYEGHSLNAHKKLLADALRKCRSKLVFVNGDLAKVLPREDFQASLREIITGTFPDQAGQSSNIAAIACKCSAEIRRTRILYRNDPRDVAKTYVKCPEEFEKEDGRRMVSYKSPTDYLESCGIKVHFADTTKIFPTIEVILSGKAYKALDYKYPDVREFIDPIITALNLDEVMQQLWHASKPSTPSDANIKTDLLASSPIPEVIRPRLGSSDFKLKGSRPRTMSVANADLENMQLTQALTGAAQDLQLPPLALPKSMYRRRNSEGDLYRLQRNWTAQEDAFIGPVPISATLAKALLGMPLEVADKEFPGVRKDSTDGSISKEESIVKKAKRSESLTCDFIPQLTSGPIVQTPGDSFMFMGAVPIPISDALSFSNLKDSDSSNSGSGKSATTQNVIDNYMQQRHTRIKTYRKRYNTATPEEKAEELRQAQIRVALSRKQGSAARITSIDQPQILNSFIGQAEQKPDEALQLHRVTSTGSMHSCRDEAASPRTTRAASPPLTFAKLRNNMA